MTIVAINGSPKPKDSASQLLISQTETILEKPIPVFQAVKLMHQDAMAEALEDILSADVLLLVFPLYIDSLPAPLIGVLTRIETEAKARKDMKPVMVYAVCNCGFYEAEQTRWALATVEHFTARMGWVWGYGVGIGGGGALLSVGTYMPNGPASSVYAALTLLGQRMLEGVGGTAPVFVKLRFPRFLYKASANWGWHREAKANHVNKSLKAKPHEKPPMLK